MPSFEQQIAAHAQEEAPRECCGLVVRGPSGGIETIRCQNIADDPFNFFVIPVADYLAAKMGAELIGYYHSHVDAGPEPSAADKHAAQAAQLPLYIHSLRDGVLGIYTPIETWRAPLEGRRFVPMVFDCVNLVWDYVRQTTGLELPLLPRTQKTYSRGVEFDWKPWLERFRANVVTGTPLPGDVLVMMTDHATKPNHLGVYLGDGIFLHQREVSKREVWAGDWQKATAYQIRLPAAEGAQ